MANEHYLAEGTSLAINGEVGADYAWSVEGLSNDAGRVCDQIDLGAAPRPYLYRWRCSAQWQATPTQYGALRIYKSESDGTHQDGDVGATDAALGDVDQLKNCKQFGKVVVEEADTSAMKAGGVVEIHERYVSLIALNKGGAAINATDSNFVFTLTPISGQVQ